MRPYIFFLLSFFSMSLFGQTRSESLLRISGMARIAVQPDQLIMNAEFQSIDTSMKTAIEGLRLQTEKHLQMLKGMNIKLEDVSTTDFSVRKNIVHHRGNSKDSGFVASQVIRATFVYTDSTMNLILAETATKAPNMAFNFDFKLSESLKAEIQAQIIELAISDAQKKANYIAAASGKTLKGIKEIQYDYTPRYSSDKSGMIQVYNYVNTYENAGKFITPRQNFNLKPKDLVFHDAVVIFFEIK